MYSATPSHRAQYRKGSALIACTLLVLATAATADVEIPGGAQLVMAGGTAQLACTDLLVHGTVTEGTGAATTLVRNMLVSSGATMDVSGASIELSQQYSALGTVIANNGGSISRVDRPECPAVGPLGDVIQVGPTSVVAVPTLHTAALGLLTLLLGGLGALRARRHTRHSKVSSDLTEFS